MKKIEVLGPGCAKCQKLAELTQQAADEIGFDYVFTKVTDIMQITTYGVMITPALVVDGDVKVSGTVPSLDEIKKMIS
ncbi:MAG: TM0996/MTH895 family glutaredoxin-like protein [candidate division Zixibacteria bacterium]|nr:TM0996/MTH895 family glutaredoxin-like protein [candidate division Zixibacteria bacterium]